jgi:hypothetical protein
MDVGETNLIDDCLSFRDLYERSFSRASSNSSEK